MAKTSKETSVPLVFMCRKCESGIRLPISETMSPEEVLDIFRELEDKPCPYCGEEEEGLWRFLYVGDLYTGDWS